MKHTFNSNQIFFGFLNKIMQISNMQIRSVSLKYVLFNRLLSIFSYYALHIWFHARNLQLAVHNWVNSEHCTALSVLGVGVNITISGACNYQSDPSIVRFSNAHTLLIWKTYFRIILMPKLQNETYFHQLKPIFVGTLNKIMQISNMQIRSASLKCVLFNRILRILS